MYSERFAKAPASFIPSRHLIPRHLGTHNRRLNCLLLGTRTRKALDGKIATRAIVFVIAVCEDRVRERENKHMQGSLEDPYWYMARNPRIHVCMYNTIRIEYPRDLDALARVSDSRTRRYLGNNCTSEAS